MSFQCRQFYLKDDRCAMKVSTDSLLLGSWVQVKPTHHRVLDIGTGCGILALMLAQRTEAKATIAGLELDAEAAAQAADNVAASPWPHKVSIQQADFHGWRAQHDYDLMVANPPYFHGQLTSSDANRRLARQGNQHLSSWLEHATKCLATHGTLAWVLPLAAERELQVPAALHLRRRCEVTTVAHKPAKLVLLEWSKQAGACQQEQLVIQDADGYTPAFRKLTSAFYLAGESSDFA